MADCTHGGRRPQQVEATVEGRRASRVNGNWTPLIVTPAHPEYRSGHSSNYGAAATLLAAYFGEDTPFILESQANPTWVRFYPNFTAAIDEVAVARVYAGIHFRTACDEPFRQSLSGLAVSTGLCGTETLALGKTVNNEARNSSHGTNGPHSKLESGTPTV